MFRFNAFFSLRENVKIEDALALAHELVEKSRKDEGCISYDLFQSTTNPRTMLFCETWKDQACIDKHASAEHFTTIVPKLEALTENGLKLEKFEF